MKTSRRRLLQMLAGFPVIGKLAKADSAIHAEGRADTTLLDYPKLKDGKIELLSDGSAVARIELNRTHSIEVVSDSAEVQTHSAFSGTLWIAGPNTLRSVDNPQTRVLGSEDAARQWELYRIGNICAFADWEYFGAPTMGVYAYVTRRHGDYVDVVRFRI